MTARVGLEPRALERSDSKQPIVKCTQFRMSHPPKKIEARNQGRGRRRLRDTLFAFFQLILPTGLAHTHPYATSMAGDAFFQKKRKRTSAGGGAGSSSSAAPKKKRGASAGRRPGGSEGGDESISDDGSEGPVGADMDLRHDYESDDGEEETAAQARVRLAKAYLDGIKADEERTNGAFRPVLGSLASP